LEGGINLYIYVLNNPINLIDSYGLKAVIYFRRLGARGTLTAVNSHGHVWTTTAYDRGPNTAAGDTDPYFGWGNDPYGKDYQLPPGEYVITPRRPGLPRAGRPTISNTSNWNLVITPLGTRREGVQFHVGMGPYHSEGCIVAPDIKRIIAIFETEYDNGGVRLIIEDIGPFPRQFYFP
jgi:hypothetical protein